MLLQLLRVPLNKLSAQPLRVPGLFRVIGEGGEDISWPAKQNEPSRSGESSFEERKGKRRTRSSFSDSPSGRQQRSTGMQSFELGIGIGSHVLFSSEADLFGERKQREREERRFSRACGRERERGEGGRTSACI